jgi:DNA-binding transcriptional MerR regulator
MSTTTERRELRVAELAAAADVSADTVRYYERAGLLPEPARSSAGYRLYDPATVERLRFIQGCQRLGLKLRDITDLLAVRDTGTCPCEPAADLLHRRLTELDAEMARLTALRVEMVAMAEALPSKDCPPPLPGTSWCPPRRGEATAMTELELTCCCDNPDCSPELCGCNCDC